MSDSPNEVIHWSDLCIGYRGEKVAGPLNGSLGSGQIIALTGPNGSGKTTFLKTLIGLIPPISGQVKRADTRAISYVPQISDMDEGFPVTVSEVVSTAIAGRTSARKRKERIDRSLDMLNVAELRGRQFFHLSGGQRQRVLLSRALCADAHFIALDEPTAGVDHSSTEATWRILRDFAKEGRSVLIITHDLARAEAYAHTVIQDLDFSGRSSGS